ncbi:hypothetical protein FGRMN_7576, partial [Fusarium graminum]
WSKTSATSRYGIFRARDVTEAEKDPVHHFTGLQGVNNCWRANERLATVQESSNGKSQWSKIENYPDEHSWNPGSLADAINRMFSKGYNSTWGHFASTKWIAESEGHPEKGYISLEYIHNNVHNLTGGSDYATGMGHMSDVPVAAFDPIFWLHHVQIDRLLAIWQCLYPKLWFDKEQPVASDSVNLEMQNVPDDKETDELQPFHTEHNDSEKKVWTCQACRDWTDMNYQYDDLAELAEKLIHNNGEFDEEEYKDKLHAHVNTLYPGTGNMIQSMADYGVDPVDLQASDGDAGSWNDYIINVGYDRYAMDGLSYTIEFFLGGPENEDSTHFNKHNYVGHVYSFSGRLSTSKGACSNCRRQAEDGTLSCAQVPLTIHLLHHLQDDVSDHSIADFDQVEDYLRLHLRWRFVKFGGEVVSDALFRDRFSNTQISVLRGIGRSIHPGRTATSGLDEALLEDGSEVTGALISIYSDYTFLPEVTDGKPGGLQMGQVAHENGPSSLWNLDMELVKDQIGEIRAHL